jgi:hypothetical protein
VATVRRIRSTPLLERRGTKRLVDRHDSWQFSAQGCPLDPLTATRIRDQTGGLPLYVQNRALLAREYYEKDASTLCDDLQNRDHVSTTLQEIVLPRVIDTLTLAECDSFGLMGLADTPLTTKEVSEILRAGSDLDIPASAAVIRKLTALGVVRQFGSLGLLLHDAF